MHESVNVGDEIRISPPANLFAPEWSAKKHLLLAGGVGITPFMSYLPEIQRRNSPCELHYMFHGTQTGAYKDVLKNQLGEAFFSYDSDLKQRCNIEKLISKQPLGTHIYICGPEALIEAAKAVAEKLSIPLSMIHYEEFAAAKPGEPFVVEIKSSGKSISVGSEESLLEALENAEVPIANLCRGGVCGQCVCSVLDGDIEHRDSFLSADEKTDGELIMPCVSRAKSNRLVLDI